MSNLLPHRWQARIEQSRPFVRRGAPFAAGVFAAFLALWLYSILLPPPPPLNQDDVNHTIATAMAAATQPPAASSLVFQVIQPSVVLIETETGGTADEESGLGTGVIINANGDILTSLHVVAGTSQINVTFADGTRSPAKILASQPENDIAVIQALQPPETVIPAVLGNPNAMHIGDEAYVVGHPFGLYDSMSSGVISGFNRTFEPPNGGKAIGGMIQIDAAVNPGNSGGPLLNRNGQVIGIVTGLVNPTKQHVFIGIGFAVPITTAGRAAGLPPY